MKQYQVKLGSKLKLSKFNPDDTNAFMGGKGTKEQALAETEKLRRKLEHLQELLFAEGKHKLLIVLQAMDAGGKDGTIRVVFDGVNPTGVRVASFKAPTAAELSHDYLWRIHQHTPAKGEMVIFNRSHYEDVLVVRVRNLAPKAVWKKRYDHIRNFEQMMADEGVTILKFYLHISKDEQKVRLQERLDNPEKRWKFEKGDLDNRALWDEYMAAFEEALSKTSTDDAPWFVIPANKNWYRNWLISKIIVETLEGLKMKYPDPEAGLEKIKIK